MAAINFTDELPVSFPVAIGRERALRALSRFTFGSLLCVTILVAIPFGTVEPWWIASYECAIFVLGALWALEIALAGWQLNQWRLLFPLAALTSFAFLQSVSFGGTIISADPFETRLVSLKLFALTLNAALLLRYTCNERRLRLLIHVVIAVAVASALFGIARQALQQSEAGFVLPYLHRGSGFGQFVNKNHFAYLAEMAIGLIGGLLFAARRERLLLYIAAMAVLWTALLFTNSRGALIATAAQVLFLGVALICLRHRERRTSSTRRQVAKPLILSAALMIAIATSAVWLGGDVLVTRLLSLPGEIQTTAQEPHAGVRRREVWNATWQLIKTHPIAGSGFGAYGIAITQFHDASGKWTPEAAHNDYLELLAAGGLIGLALIAWMGFEFIRSAQRQLSNANSFRRAACLAALTGIVGVLVHNVVDFGLHVTANAVALIALGVIATRDLFPQPFTLKTKPQRRKSDVLESRKAYRSVTHFI